MRTRTGFDADERKSRFSIAHFNSPIHLLIVYSGAKLIFLRWTCRGGVLSLNSKQISLNLLAVISVHWNEKV